MHAENFVLTNYLARIAYDGDVTPSADTLKRVMMRQLLSVPFENLDVQAGKVVSLNPEDIVDKIVNRRQGGYCYEVNSLFAMVLQSIGIK